MFLSLWLLRLMPWIFCRLLISLVLVASITTFTTSPTLCSRATISTFTSEGRFTRGLPPLHSATLPFHLHRRLVLLLVPMTPIFLGTQLWNSILPVYTSKEQSTKSLDSNPIFVYTESIKQNNHTAYQSEKLGKNRLTGNVETVAYSQLLIGE